MVERRFAGFPPRRPDALAGSTFLERTASMKGPEREAAVLSQVLKGNVPSHLRMLVPVQLSAATKNRGALSATVWVLPDYLAIGSDEDYVRIPMSLPTAAKLAEQFGFALPTKKMVDAVYDQASVRVRPKPLPAGPEMTRNAYFQLHNDVIEAQLRHRDAFGLLVAGHKKDLVLTNRLARHPGQRVAIYGWHQPGAIPIQALSTVHEAEYADYSHGVRFVSGSVRVEGMDMTLEEVLSDGELAKIFSSEGKIERIAELLDPTTRDRGAPIFVSRNSRGLAH